MIIATGNSPLTTSRLLRADGLLRWIRSNVERLIWSAALFALVFFPPGPSDVSLCPLSWFSLPCPGDGLGTSISLALRFSFADSFASHWLGLPVLAWMLLRITMPSLTLRRAIAWITPTSNRPTT